MVVERPSNASKAMLNPKCQRSVNRTHHSYGGTLNWSRHDEDLLLSATSWGSLVAQLPSMLISRQFQSKNVLFVVICLHVIFNVLIPLCATHIGLIAVFCLRVLIGVAHSFIDVAIFCLIDKWFPSSERSTALAIFSIGGQVSGIVGGPITAQICASSLGWQANYYLTSFLGAIFCICWFLFSAESPQQCKRIKQGELEYLTENVHVEEKTKRPVPYIPLLTSLATWAQFIIQVAAGLAQSTTQSYLPSFYKEVVLISVIMNGYFIAIPNVFSFIVRLSWSIGVDRLKRKSVISNTLSVKVSQGISSYCMSIFFIVLAFFIDCTDPYAALIISSLIASCQALESAGYQTKSLTAMSMFWAQSARLSTPYIVGALRKNNLHGWRNVFLMVSIVNTIGGTAYLTMGSGEEQEWAKISENEDKFTKL
ncbi:unnamed protein product [Auanema sp. JU1783]|nr:unnamed protein product [Auanema sp. JU1783]